LAIGMEKTSQCRERRRRAEDGIRSLQDGLSLRVWHQANCGGEDAKAARAVVTPVSHRLPS
jgi:hypothetical protein